MACNLKYAPFGSSVVNVEVSIVIPVKNNDPADVSELLAAARKFPVATDFCIAGYRKNRKDTAWKRFQSKVANNIRRRILNLLSRVRSAFDFTGSIGQYNYWVVDRSKIER